jgi:sugar lactone lactonase YvrE
VTTSNTFPITALDAPASLLGESPVWHPVEQQLYWTDIPGKTLHCHAPSSGQHRSWKFDVEIGSLAPMRDGGLLLAKRDGLWRFDPETSRQHPLSEAPYDISCERFNDGKCDPQGRFWVGTIYEPRDPPLAALYCYEKGKVLRRVTGDITTCNGLGWSPDGCTLYFSDTKAHTIYTQDFDANTAGIGPRRVFAQFPLKQTDQALNDYGGRPDGAAVDVEGAYWCAMFEGQRLLRLSPEGKLLQEIRLPVRCATMPCFGGPDLKTLYITTSREKRPDAELADQPLAGRVLTMRVETPGMPANLFG